MNCQFWVYIGNAKVGPKHIVRALRMFLEEADTGRACRITRYADDSLAASVEPTCERCAHFGRPSFECAERNLFLGPEARDVQHTFTWLYVSWELNP